MRMEIKTCSELDIINYKFGEKKNLAEVIDDNNEANEETKKIQGKKKILKYVIAPDLSLVVIGENRFKCTSLVALKRKGEWYILNDELSDQQAVGSLIIRSHKKDNDTMVIRIGDKKTIIQASDYVFALGVTEYDRVYFFFKVPQTFENIKSTFYCLDESLNSKIYQMILNIAFLLDEKILTRVADILIPDENRVDEISAK